MRLGVEKGDIQPLLRSRLYEFQHSGPGPLLVVLRIHPILDHKILAILPIRFRRNHPEILQRVVPGKCDRTDPTAKSPVLDEIPLVVLDDFVEKLHRRKKLRNPGRVGLSAADQVVSLRIHDAGANKYSAGREFDSESEMRSHGCNVFQRFFLNGQISALHISRLARAIRTWDGRFMARIRRKITTM